MYVYCCGCSSTWSFSRAAHVNYPMKGINFTCWSLGRKYSKYMHAFICVCAHMDVRSEHMHTGMYTNMHTYMSSLKFWVWTQKKPIYPTILTWKIMGKFNFDCKISIQARLPGTDSARRNSEPQGGICMYACTNLFATLMLLIGTSTVGDLIWSKSNGSERNLRLQTYARSSLLMRVYVCMLLCCIMVNTASMHTWICVHMRWSVCVCVCMDVCIKYPCIHECPCIHEYACICIDLCVCVYVWMDVLHTYIHGIRRVWINPTFAAYHTTVHIQKEKTLTLIQHLNYAGTWSHLHAC
jgi:hypothetical protein